MHGKSEITFAFGCEHSGRGISGVIYQQRVVVTDPFSRIRWIGDDCIEWLIIPMIGFKKRVTVVYVEVGIVDVVQKHIDSAQVVGGDVQFLTEEAFLYVMLAKYCVDWSFLRYSVAWNAKLTKFFGFEGIAFKFCTDV